MVQDKLYMGQESLMGWDRRRWLNGTGEVDITSKQDDFFGNKCPILTWEDDCYQNCKVIVTKNLRWYYHLTMDEKWTNYRGMASGYWMSHQYHLAFYFWCWSNPLIFPPPGRPASAASCSLTPHQGYPFVIIAAGILFSYQGWCGSCTSRRIWFPS